VTIRRCGFELFASAAGDGEADLITMVAVLHHLDLDDTLARIPGPTAAPLTSCHGPAGGGKAGSGPP
jgi:hypothetical protein